MFKKLVQSHYEVVATPNLEGLAKKITDKYFGDLDLPAPKFKIVNNAESKWLGRAEWMSKTPGLTTIKIQKSILNDEKTLDRILCHELIHHADYMVNLFQGKESPRSFKSKDGHGEFFQKYADKINLTMGKDYVAEKSDESYVQERALIDFFVLVEMLPNKKLGYCSSLRLSSQQKELVERHKKDNGAKLFKVKDEKWRNTQAKIGKGFAVPKDEKMIALQELFESGKEVH